MPLPTPLTESELAEITERAKRLIESPTWPAGKCKLVCFENEATVDLSTLLHEDMPRLTEALRSQREQLTAIEQILDAAGVERERQPEPCPDPLDSVGKLITLTLAERVQRVVGRKGWLATFKG